MTELSRISKWQCLFRFFDGAIWDQKVGTEEVSTFKTELLVGTRTPRPEIAGPVAEEISRLQAAIQAHRDLQAQRRAQGVVNESEQAPEIALPTADEIERQIAELLGEEHVAVVSAQVEELEHYGMVHPSQVELIEINENSRIDGRVFPRSFNCAQCGHYEIVDPNRPGSLECPCCRGWCPQCQRTSDSAEVASCEACGTRLLSSPLKQYNIVYACPRCANIEELSPRTQNIGQIGSGQVPCSNCSQGHLHLRIGSSLTLALWICPMCDHQEHLDKFCHCHIREGDGQGAVSSIMRPIPTSASIAVPLVRSYLWLGNQVVSLTTLEQNHNQHELDDPYSWQLSGNLDSKDLEIVRTRYGIEDVFSIPEVRTTTVIYGYRSGISSYPVSIPEDERLAQLFTDRRGRRYRAYFADTIGRGLVFRLSKERLVSVLLEQRREDATCTYDDLAGECLSYLVGANFQEIVGRSGPVALAELLHAWEHALFKTIVNHVGLDVFGSKILLEDAAIVLYEREEVGPGGLVQVSDGSVLLRVLQDVRRALWNCPQLCDSACPACLFINDYYCQPFVPTEVERWIPPNALLNRNLGRQMVRQNVPASTSS